MPDNLVVMEGAVCPIPLSHDEQIVMGHGSGGKMAHDLIARYFAASFDNPALRAGSSSQVRQSNDLLEFLAFEVGPAVQFWRLHAQLRQDDHDLRRRQAVERVDPLVDLGLQGADVSGGVLRVGGEDTRLQWLSGMSFASKIEVVKRKHGSRAFSGG